MAYQNRFDQKRVELSSVTLSVIDEGSGPPVLLLHGFPDRAAMWSDQIEHLLAAGYRVIAPDMRGFGDSDRPAGVANYAGELAVADAVELLAHLGVDRAHLVAHDWGAMIAWSIAAMVPDVVATLTVMSVGHPRAFFVTGDRQRQLSWYVLFFNQVGVAEDMLPRNDWQWYRSWAFDGAARGTNPQLDQQLADLERPGALEAGLNWYRANFAPEMFLADDSFAALPNVTCPVLAMWSDKEMALTEEQMTGSADYVDGSWEYHRIPGAGHWLPRQAPAEVNDHLGRFLSAHSGIAAPA
ncbi:alpha/beta hydrolase [Mycobacterium sp. M26]|uniref:alpha/beta fold hydrolase n=1 Tax=Mycobacterium sp. M26 TaxID=1762962 RepID=UPI00073E142A|nr:alpha/beta hydrolase [Mycobacterium sp. M26]